MQKSGWTQDEQRFWIFILFIFDEMAKKFGKNMKRKTNVQFEFNPHFIHAALTAYKRKPKL